MARLAFFFWRICAAHGIQKGIDFSAEIIRITQYGGIIDLLSDTIGSVF
jgi:hypothetical protein